ncbi:MAG: YkgJ family cysteine cluster protein [bacterium]|nr:YkgJ family cysteine cluster protein [bacterium]
MNEKLYQRHFRIINEHVDQALVDMQEGGEKISCGPGCSYCCHLLVEISEDEADALADWFFCQAAKTQQLVWQRLISKSGVLREFFSSRRATQKFITPYPAHIDIPQGVFTRYFSEVAAPCPFLEDGRCVAYEHRPGACRLHMVSSAPELCAPCCDDDSLYHLPPRVEQLRREVLEALPDPEVTVLFGELSILVRAAIEKRLAETHFG